MKNFKKIWLIAWLLTAWLLLTWCGGWTPDVAWWTASANYEEITLWHDGYNTIPQVTTLPAGKDYKFVITPESNGVWCMSTIKRAWTQWWDLVAKGRPIEMVIDNAQPWEYLFVCNGMDMEQGKIVIEG